VQLNLLKIFEKFVRFYLHIEMHTVTKILILSIFTTDFYREMHVRVFEDNDLLSDNKSAMLDLL